ncbi:hypothetical protein [Solirubrobacter soli]|uniref:hypothetical protein n=1 Tax=Solirubrobacter soli TaxID=363832 RepID=UPI00041DD337|nr:hypothetical protein [Solirubrobacter soli]
MFMRAFLLSMAVLALAAPAASAGPFDKVVPIYDASDGVSVTRSGGKIVFRFGPKAAKLYRGLAGKKAVVACGHPIKDDGSYGGGGDTGGGNYSWHAGMFWTDVRLPSRRGRVSVRLPNPSDVCFISVKDPRDDVCIPAVGDDDYCMKVVVTRTEQGVIDLDERLRALELDSMFDQPIAELQEELGDEVVALDSPDATPPPGMVGLFNDEQTTVAATLLRDGRRWYVRRDGDVFSTNVPAIGTSGHLDSLF